jgi:hypothetical protein
LLGQAPPTPVDWLVAVLAAPVVLAVDALHKAYRARRRPHRTSAEAPAPLALPR